LLAQKFLLFGCRSSGTRHNTIVDVSAFKKHSFDMMDYCISHPDMNLMEAIKNALGAERYADQTGNSLKDLCSLYPQHSEKTAMCIGYIFGTLDVIRAYDRVKKCEPTSGLTADQLILMTIKYLSDHPERLNYSATSLIFDMYTKAFPCPQKQN